LKFVGTIRLRLIKNEGYKYSEYKCDIGCLQDVIDNELGDIVFGFLPPDRSSYFQQDELFGPEVNARFPSAVADIKDAGNCYAHGTDTACVMHLMRVLELGLKSLAKAFKFKSDHANWGALIDQIETKIRDIEKKKRKPRNWRADRQFYSEAAKDFRYVKDAWRNYAMHVHERYDGPQALSIMNHVRELMQHIATRLKE
jgi:hypothetical protein